GSNQAVYRVVGRDDGRVRHVMTNWKVLFRNQRPVRMIGTVRDVSEHKRLKQELQERRGEMELFSKQQVAAQTAAAIAHELNQPLVSVAAYSEAALRMLRAGNKNPEKLLRALEGSMEQAQRAGRTVHELLDFLHRGEATVEPIDIGGMVHESIAIAEESGCSRFRPVLELAADLPPVLANRLQLQKVLVNLLHNGAEAMRTASVHLPMIVVKVQTLSHRQMVQVTVQDSGPGFQGEAAKRLFEPFFTTKPEGIGLGLAISRALVEAHGGQLWADAAAGPGATFHFTLPFAP
ncbi:MAG TPA: ATP-binding protein, partial [Rhodocyclaceae bacterium]|nr:ATP-binding protein [Rhodocyclaceae bacterium]